MATTVKDPSSEINVVIIGETGTGKFQGLEEKDFESMRKRDKVSVIKFNC
jgi:transcriptional regulator with GAF, ATPase, and Fis domain